MIVKTKNGQTFLMESANPDILFILKDLRAAQLIGKNAVVC